MNILCCEQNDGITGRFDTKSFRYKFIQCKKFQVLGLKNEEYSSKLFFVLTRKLNLKGTKLVHQEYFIHGVSSTWIEHEC